MKSMNHTFTGGESTLAITARKGKNAIKVVVRKRTPGARTATFGKVIFALTEEDVENKAKKLVDELCEQAQKVGWVEKPAAVAKTSGKIEIPTAPGFEKPADEKSDEKPADEKPADTEEKKPAGRLVKKAS